MPMGMKEMMGLLTQLKRMRQPDVIPENPAGPGLHTDPGMRLGGFYSKGAGSPQPSGLGRGNGSSLHCTTFSVQKS